MAGKIIMWTATINTRREAAGSEFCTVAIRRNGRPHGVEYVTGVKSVETSPDAYDSLYKAGAQCIPPAEEWVRSRGLRVARPGDWKPDLTWSFSTLLEPLEDHYTAWITGALNTGMIDLVVTADASHGHLTGPDGEQGDTLWESTGIDVLTARTHVPADGGDLGKAAAEAAEILTDSMWELAGAWQAVHTGLICTVKPVR